MLNRKENKRSQSKGHFVSITSRDFFSVLLCLLHFKYIFLVRNILNRLFRALLVGNQFNYLNFLNVDTENYLFSLVSRH